jgi:arylsulfatase A
MRHTFALLCAATTLTLGGASTAHAQAAQDARRPNIIVYFADDIGREAFGSYGGTSYRMPNIDRLATEGVRFTRAYSTALCTPTRTAFLTGQYNFRNYDDFGYLDTAQRTIANYLQAAGYATAVTGKWQLGGSFQTPHNFGFDEYLVWQLEAPDYWTRYKNPALTRNGEPTRKHPGKYGPDMMSDFVLDFIERHRNQPFFIYYAETLTHDPFQPPPDHPDYATHNETSVDDVKYFPSMVSYMDKIVGRLTAKLDALGIREQTLILFMGDNGTVSRITSSMNGRLVQGDKGGRLDAANHVALIANWKGTVKPGQVRDDLVDVLDLFSTAFEAGGSTIANVRQDGFSLYPTLTKGAPSPRKWIFTDFYRGRTPGPNTLRSGGASRYVHDGRFKLYPNGQFYDYIADPLEQTPLSETAMSAEARSVYQTLRDVLTRMEGEVKLWDSRRLDEPLQVTRGPAGNPRGGGAGRGGARGAGAGGAEGQVTTGSVAGAVRDAQGRMIPGATLVLVSNTRGTRSAPVVSNASGEFLFVNVSPDTYTIEVTMPSFKTLQRSNVAVGPGGRVAVGTLTLERGL